MGREEDLGALCARLTRRLIAAERPILARHGVSMWEYVVMSALARGEPETQRALAEAIGYDKTRLIALLDRLQELGLLTREPDTADRRARRVRLTAAGRARHAAIRRDIRAMESELLHELEDDQRRTLRAALARLAGPRA